MRTPTSSKLDYLKELSLFKWHLRSKKIEELLNLPEIKDPVKRKVTELLSYLSSVTMTSYPDLYAYIILKTGNYAVRHGNTEMAFVGYLGYSITAGSILGDYKAADEYRKVCIDLVNKYGRSTSKCVMYFVIGSLISHWSLDASCGIEYLKKAIISGMEAGNILIMGYAHCILLEVSYLLGASLKEMSEEIRRKGQIAKRLKHENLASNVGIYEKVVCTLLGENADTLALGVAKFRNEGLYQSAKEDQTVLATYYIHEMFLCYITGNYMDALIAAQKVRLLEGAIIGFLISAEYNFYYSLTITVAYNKLPFELVQKRYK